MSTSAWPLVRAFREGQVSGAARRADAEAPASDPLALTTRMTVGDAELERLLSELVAAGRTAWPQLAPVEPAVLVRYVGQRLIRAEEVDPRRGGDFTIACACAAGATSAIAALDAAAASVVVPALRRLRLDDGAIDEVRERLRISLFVSTAERPAHIGSWAGRGDLLGWLRVCATREGLKSIRRTRTSGDEALDLAEHVAADHGDPHDAYELRLYAPVFREALAAALGELEPRERTLLAQHHLDGLSIDRLAALHGVHRATAARWVTAARERLVEMAQTTFKARTKLEESACASVLRRIRPELDLTLRRVLGGDAA